MLSRVTVSNFQSLGSVALDLGRITVIIGHSDSGKSAFLRAIESAAFNDSVFDYATRINGQATAEKMLVEFQFQNKTKVIWERTKATAKFLIEDQNGVQFDFAKMGRGHVPEDVQSYLGIREITIDANDARRIQFGGQHDPPFLIFDKGGVFASRVLGRLTGVNVLSAAAKECQSDKVTQGGFVESHTNEVLKLKKELEAYSRDEQRHEFLLNLKTKLDGFKERQNKLREVLRIVESWRLNKVALSTKKFDPVLLELIAKVEMGLQILWNQLAKLERLKRTKLNWVKTKAEKVDLRATELDLPDVSIGRLQEINKLCSMLRNVHTSRLAHEVSLGHSLKKLEDIGQNIGIIEKEFPLCPFTGQFNKQQGVFRCHDLMSHIDGNKRT